jgi:uncharacterized protein (TIRG00374 family)
MIQKLSIIISLALFAYILSMADVGSIQILMSKINFSTCMIILLLYCVYILTRALRLNVIFNGRGSSNLYTLLHSAIVHNLYLSYLPFRLGDVLFANICRRYAGLNTGTSVAALISIRILDVTSLSVFFVLALSLISRIGFTPSRIALAIALISSALYLSFHADKTIRKLLPTLDWLMKALPDNRARRFHEIFEHTADSFRDMLTVRSYLIGFMFTIAGWISLTAIYWQLLTIIGVSDSLVTALLLITVQSLAMMLPIQTIAGLGVADAAITYAFTLAGLSTTDAVSHALVIRLIMIIMPVILFLLFYTYHNVYKVMRA